MQTPIRSAFVKRLASDQLETNGLALNFETINNEIQPTYELMPEADIFKNSTSVGTLYTTPLDRQFYLTYLRISATISAGANGNATINVTLPSGEVQTVTCNVSSDGSAGSGVGSNELEIIFPFRGLKLKKGSTVTTAVSSVTIMSYSIVGYLGSDRAM